MQMRKLLLALTAILFFTGYSFAQKTITGKVIDEKGNPVPNASVLVKGTSTGTVTKMDGSYSIIVPAKSKTLVISSVNMREVQIEIGNLSEVNVTLQTSERSLQ